MEDDGLDIQSLSVVEAEFIYNKVDEAQAGGSGGGQQGLVERKRTINLEAFKIIRVVGKGAFIFTCCVCCGHLLTARWQCSR